MQVGNYNLRVRPMTAGDLAAIAPAFRLMMEARGNGAAALFDLADRIDTIIATLKAVLEGEDVARLRDLPLHEFVAVLEQAIQAWIGANGPYMAAQVAPAVTQLARTMETIAATMTAGK